MAESFTLALTLILLGGYESAIAPKIYVWNLPLLEFAYFHEIIFLKEEI